MLRIPTISIESRVNTVHIGIMPLAVSVELRMTTMHISNKLRNSNNQAMQKPCDVALDTAMHQTHTMLQTALMPGQFCM